MSNNSA